MSFCLLCTGDKQYLTLHGFKMQTKALLVEGGTHIFSHKNDAILKAIIIGLILTLSSLGVLKVTTSLDGLQGWSPLPDDPFTAILISSVTHHISN